MFTLKVTAAAQWDLWDSIAVALALFITVWLFTLKLRHSTISAIRGTSSWVFRLRGVGSNGIGNSARRLCTELTAAVASRC